MSNHSPDWKTHPGYPHINPKDVYVSGMATFAKPIPPIGISLDEFKKICRLAENNVTMYDALERLKTTYELLNGGKTT